jgi:hypothetical protein
MTARLARQRAAPRHGAIGAKAPRRTVAGELAGRPADLSAVAPSGAKAGRLFPIRSARDNPVSGLDVATAFP